MKKLIARKLAALSICLPLIGGSIHCGDPENLAEMTAPIAYAVAMNALKNGKPQGRFLVDLSFQSLQRAENSWPSGTIVANISDPESNRQATVTYILSGSHVATAIVEIPEKPRKQYSINLAENAAIFGQAQTVENFIERLSEQLTVGLKPAAKIAVFDAESLNGNTPTFGKSVAESVVTNLSRRKFIVVERRMLDQALREMNFQSSGMTGDTVRKEMGRFLGADTIVVATIKGQREEIVINARSVDVETGTIQSSAQSIFPRYLISGRDLKGID